MTRNELNIKISAILTTLDLVAYAPESMIYLAVCNSEQSEYTAIKGMLCSAGLITANDNHTLTITEAGRAVAAKINNLTNRLTAAN